MKIKTVNRDVYQFEFSPDDVLYTVYAESFSEAKQMLLDNIDKKVEQEMQRMFTEFYKKGLK